VVTSLRERHTLFDENGRILRCRVTLTLKSYRSVETQRRQTPPRSPDRTRVRVMREGETLSQIANELYSDPRLWRFIAEENGIDRPLFVEPGTALSIPSVGPRP
jgi:nucleoid-associated protein YgaU